MTIQCELSKYVEAYPIPSKDTLTVAKAFVSNFVLRYGIPKAIVTDRGTEFVSSTMNEVCKLLNIDKQMSTAYHHQSLGALENSHKSLRNFLRIQCDENMGSWGYWLPFWTFAYNNTVHTSTTYAPYELVFGKKCNIPTRLTSNVVEPIYNIDNYALELRYRLQLANKDAREKLIADKIKRKCAYDKNSKSTVYEKDDLILLKNETGTKMDRVFHGPYSIVEDCGPNVKLLKDNKIELVHKNRIKPFHQA